MTEERQLIFHVPQDELVIPSCSAVVPERALIPKCSQHGRGRRVEDEVAIVNEPHEEAATPQHSFGGASNEVRAITFLLITVTCVLLFGSMIMTDINNRTTERDDSYNETEIGPDVKPTEMLPPKRTRHGGRSQGGKRRPTRKGKHTLHELLRGSKCSTKACLKQGIKVIEETEPAVKPCDDFYQHVCSRWQQQQPAGQREDRISADYVLLDLFSKLFVSVLKSDNATFQQQRFFYDECLRPQPNLFRNVKETLLRHLDLKGWPYTDDSTIPDADLNAKVASLFSELGLETFFSVRRGRRGLQLGQPNNLILRHFTESEPHLASRWLDKAYDMLLETLPKKRLLPKGSATNVTAMELQLRKILEPAQSILDVGRLDNCTVTQMADLPHAGYFDLHQFIQVATGGKAAISESSSVQLSSTRYLDKLGAFPATKHDILNYVAFRVMLDLSPLLSNSSVRAELASIAYSRYPEFAERLTPSEMCIRFLERYEPVLPTYVTYKRGLEMLGGDSVVREILDSLKASFFTELQNLSGFSSAFKRHVSVRLREVPWEALMPRWLTEKNARDAYADGIYINNPRHPVPHYFYFWLRTSALKRRQMLFTQPTAWSGGFLSTSATLAPPYRQLEIPLPVFDFLMSNDSSVAHLQIPRVGPRVYRELFRFMYHEAINFDLERQVHDDVRYLSNLRQCLERQYRELDFNPTRAPLNSVKTSASDILDLLALQAAFAAYVRKLSGNDGDYRLASAPNLSGQRLFFIYYARSMCEKANPRFLVKLMTNGPTSPAWFRVNGPLRNIREFAQAFSCAQGTPMNPSHKCI
ncbi:membrane metallo-endopeptidase-like 1 [Ornithodoros turicata]|uniref:membrane metallo-endopeptidase-like 1 n=1 Tax=Ornithodoros turicata TaxID=34597 RepID=UPI003138F7D8